MDGTFWGFLVVIYITAMYQIDGSLYEAAEIEGASKLQKFRFITFPMIRPTFIFTIYYYYYLVSACF